LSRAGAGYWDGLARTKVFTHPLRVDWLERHGGRDDGLELRLADVGCGQGRLWSELSAERWRIVGVDRSGEMLARARERNTGSEVVQGTAWAWPLATESVDGALLVSVLTCVTGDADQRRVLDEARRCLRPGGLLFSSDLLLQADARNRRRYARGMGEFGRYGCFRLADGGAFRHMSAPWVAELFSDFEPLEFEEHAVVTMNGNPARAFRGLWRRR
jgi:SAM-dependent methyltransferase